MRRACLRPAQRLVALSVAAWLPIAAGATAALASSPSCVLLFSMTSGTAISNLDFAVDYSAADGRVAGTTVNPTCSLALGGNALGAFGDDGLGTLSVSMIRQAAFSAPVDLAGCRFEYSGSQPVPADFRVTVTNAGRDGVDNSVSPLPVVAVTQVDCPGALPTTTTTTTTLPAGSRCGQPVSSGAKPTASDALRVLKAAVGVASCSSCVCDANGNGNVTAADALVVLRAAVGLPVVLACPAC